MAGFDLIGGDVAEQLIKLKQQPGKDILVIGSASLVRWLLREGVLDLLVFPVITGRCKRLFDGEDSRTALKLAHCQPFSNGVVHLTYQPA